MTLLQLVELQSLLDSLKSHSRSSTRVMLFLTCVQLSLKYRHLPLLTMHYQLMYFTCQDSHQLIGRTHLDR